MKKYALNKNDNITMIRVYIGLGSNLSKPEEQIKSGLKALARLPDTDMILSSPLYQSKPLGSQNQPDYLNAVAALDTLLSPRRLLDHAESIEFEHGRVREKDRWASRTLDLDILLYGDKIIDTLRLGIPHYGIKDRPFVLCPLSDIAPDLIFPDGESLAQCLIKMKQKGVMDIFRL